MCTDFISLVNDCIYKCQGSKLRSQLRHFSSELCRSQASSPYTSPQFASPSCTLTSLLPASCLGSTPAERPGLSFWKMLLLHHHQLIPRTPHCLEDQCTLLTTAHSPPRLAQPTLLCTPPTMVHPVLPERSASSTAHVCISIHMGSSSQSGNQDYGLNCTVQWILIYSE